MAKIERKKSGSVVSSPTCLRCGELVAMGRMLCGACMLREIQAYGREERKIPNVGGVTWFEDKKFIVTEASVDHSGDGMMVRITMAECVSTTSILGTKKPEPMTVEEYEGVKWGPIKGSGPAIVSYEEWLRSRSRYVEEPPF